MRERAKKGRMPEFSSLEEEAEFWDTHDTTDYEDDFRPVKVLFSRNLSEGITVRFDPETLAKSITLAPAPASPPAPPGRAESGSAGDRSPGRPKRSDRRLPAP
jgi:hypothetical protein